MKKRLIAIVVIAIMLATILSGCTLFVKNEERDYKQVLATVESKGVTATITKGEFIEYYSQNAPTYVQYYNWTAARCVNEFMNALARKEIVLIEAKDYFSKKNNVAITADIMDFLSENEQKWVIRRTNKSFQDALDAQIKQIVADDKANSGADNDTNTDDTETNMPSPRPEFPVEDTESEYSDKTAYESQDKFFEALDKDTTLSDTQKKAIKNLKKNLSDQYKDYDYFLQSQAESRLLTKFQDAVKKGEVPDFNYSISDEDVLYKYNLTLNTQMTANKIDTNYTTALDGDSMILFHNNQYVKVKSILLKFTDKQTELLTSVKDFYKTNGDVDSLVNAFRDMLVFGNQEGQSFPFPVEQKYLQLLVNISNLDYKADSACTDKDCECAACENNPNYDEDSAKCKIELEDEDGNFILNVNGCTCPACENNAFEKYNVPFQDVINMIAKAVNEEAVKAEAEYDTKYPSGNATGKQMYVAQARLDAFEKWMYKVNDDSGIFEKGEYVATPDGKKSDYVTEYTALIRAIIKDGATAGKMATTQSTYTVDGKEVTIHTTTTDGESISYIVNDYGVHIVMMSTVPVDLIINDQANITETKSDNGKDTYYTLGMDAIVGFDKDTGLPITVKEQLKKDMEKQAETDLYNRFERNLLKDYGSVLFASSNSDIFKLNKKVFNEIIDLTGAEKGDINIK